MSDEPSMKLPEGKTCGDCRNHGTCKALFGCSEDNGECDWFPVRFYPRRSATLPAGDAPAEET